MERKASINTLINNAAGTPNQPSLFASFLPLPRLSGIPAHVERMNSRATKVLASWLNFIVQLASSQPPLMVLKVEMQSQKTEPSNFYSSPLIQAEEDIQSGKFEAFLSHHSA